MTDLETFRKEELDNISKRYGTGGGGDDYDPHEHRDISHGTNFFETLVHVLKASLGTGILAMPIAFKQAGLINGFVFTFVISGVCLYGIHILIRSQYELCKILKVPYLTYPLAMRVALLSGPMWLTKLSRASQILIDSFLIVYQTGACTAYVIFVSENLKKLVDHSANVNLHLEYYILMTFFPFLLIMSVPNMKWLAPFSLLSNILTFVTCGILLHHIFTGLNDFSKMKYFGDPTDFPLFVGIVLFAVAAMGVITTVEKNMEKPKQFGRGAGVLNISMTIITVSYAFMGFVGYWRHPHDIEASITLNLNDKDVKAKIIQALYLVAIYITYGLNGMVPVDIVWYNYLIHRYGDSRMALLYEYLVRYSLVVLTFFLAFTIPLLGEIISLFGALCMSGLEIIFPAIIHLCVKWPDQLGTCKWVLVTDILMIVMGFVGLFSGTYSSIRDIVKKLKHKHTLF